MAFNHFNWIVAIATLLSIFSGADGKRHRKRHDGQWVDTWATMPQLTESANLPPAPFVNSLKH
jgi:hypothetical protein